MQYVQPDKDFVVYYVHDVMRIWGGLRECVVYVCVECSQTVSCT